MPNGSSEPPLPHRPAPSNPARTTGPAQMFQPGQRVRLIHTADPYTRLLPGTTGTVASPVTDERIVSVRWDDGSRLAMLLDAGDRIEPADPPPTPTTTDGLDEATLTAVREAATGQAEQAVAWWAQDTFGGHSRGDTRATARRLLAGLDDGDPAVYDTFPALPDDNDYPQLIPGWDTMPEHTRAAAVHTFADLFFDRVNEAIYAASIAAASPTGRDLSHLHPNLSRLGRVGVFAGDWAWTTNDRGEQRIPVGFVGVRVGTWNGWAVFTCTREVAEAIVADQDRERAEARARYADAGLVEPVLSERIRDEYTLLSFDGDTIIADQSGLYDDPDAIERIAPDDEGRYCVMGRNWTWIAVDPTDCDQIVGELPELGRAQWWHMLTHTPDMRVRTPPAAAGHPDTGHRRPQRGRLHRRPDAGRQPGRAHPARRRRKRPPTAGQPDRPARHRHLPGRRPVARPTR
jgi:Domain of unknown function (DUF4314)